MKRGYLLLVVLCVTGYLPVLSAQTAPPAAEQLQWDTSRYVPATFAYDTTTYTLFSQTCAGGEFRLAYAPAAAEPVFGESVPFGRRWTPGSDGRTLLTTTTDLTLNGKLLPAGQYVLLVVPNAGTWELILNANPATTVRNYLRQDDVLTFTAPVTDTLAEAHAPGFVAAGATATGFTLHYYAGNTRLTVAVAAENIMDSYHSRFADKPVGPDGASLLGMARYLYTTEGDAEEALDYAERSIEWEENCFNLYYKGLILVRLGRTDEAVSLLSAARDRAEAEGVARVVTGARVAISELENR